MIERKKAYGLFVHGAITKTENVDKHVYMKQTKCMIQRTNVYDTFISMWMHGRCSVLRR